MNVNRLLPQEMFPIKKMYKGRNSSPPGSHIDYDYRSSFNAQELEKAITRLKAVKKKVVVADLDFIREALEKSLKVTTTLSAINCGSPEASQTICNSHESALTNCSPEENSKDISNELVSLQKLENFKSVPHLKPNSEKILEENGEDSELSFLRKKILEIKENSVDYSSTRGHEHSSDDSSRSKIPERGKRNSTECRKKSKKSHSEKKKELKLIKHRTYKDMLEENTREKDRRKGKISSSSSNFSSDESSKHSNKYRSNKMGKQSKSYGASRQKRRSSSWSSDKSDYSHELRSYRRDRRSRSRERVSRRYTYSSDGSREYSPRNISYSRRPKESRSRSRSRDRVPRRKRRDSISSDRSPEYLPKNKSHRRNARHRSENSSSRSRSRSRDRVSRKKYSENIKSELSLSDSNASVKAPVKSLLEHNSEGIPVLSVENSDTESLSAKASEFILEENPRPLPFMPNQFKLSPRSEFNDDSLPYDETSAGAFMGSENYYCKVCQKNLNGIVCYETHMNGKKHKKAEKALFRAEASNFQAHQAVEKSPKEPFYRPELLTSAKDGNMLESSETARFQEKIDKHLDDPIVGLEFLDEIRYSDETITYYCNLCKAPCVQTSVFSHLIGSRHYLTFFKMIDSVYYERIKERPKGQLLATVREVLLSHEKKYGRQKMKVKIGLKDTKPTVIDKADELEPMENQVNPDDYYHPSGNYYCSICDAYMNNETMLHSHVVGKRHIKNLKKKNSGAIPSMPIASTKKERDPNALSRLERRLMNYHETPIVGLNFIRETQNMNGENYTCYICKSCTSIDIIEHITSMKHQIKFLETVDANKKIPNGIGNIRELEISDQHRGELVQEECRRIEEEHGRGKVDVYR